MCDMCSPSVSLESCSWDSVTVGSQCEWSDEESIAAGKRDMLLTPTRTPAARYSDTCPGPSPLSCDWSEHEESRDAVRRSPRNRKRKKLFDPSPAPLRPALPSPLACATHTCSSPISEVDWNLFSAMETYGCQENCIGAVHGLTEYDILLAHSSFASKTTVEQRRWIFDYLATHCPNDDNGRKDVRNITFLVCAKTVCLTAWLAVLSISSSRFYEIRKEFVNGQTEPTPKRPRSMSVKSQQAIAWMSSYFERVGDKRPDKDGIYLPTCLTEKAIHSRMIEELYREEESQAVCLSQFNRLFRTNFPNVTIPKECRFTKCNFCTLIKNEMFKSSSNKCDKERLKTLLDQHLQLQEQERKRYYMHRQKAVECPDEVISMIVDGMDQNKTNLPSFVRVTKACQSLWSLRTHLTGCLVHGVGAHNYFDFLQWSHDCNLTLCTLLQTLLEVAKTQPLAPRLLIQMDNCVRENKNKYVMGFFAILVQLEIFTEIELGFLMVGHTHEDIDQTFSCLSRYLRKHDALTMPEMHGCCKAANHAVRGVITLEYIFDIKSWLSPHLAEIHGHTSPHVFLFRKNSEGTAVMFTKHWSHDDWEPLEGLRLLKSIPEDTPTLVDPDLTKVDIPHLRRDIVKYAEAGVLPPEASKWWEGFLDRFEQSFGSCPPVAPAWYLSELSAIRQSYKSPTQPPSNIPEKILSVHKSQMEQTSTVTIGKRKPVAKARQATEESTEVTLQVGCMVALRLQKYAEDIPQIAKVVKLTELDVTVEWWIGAYGDTWREWKERGRVITETFPRNAVIHNSIRFTKSLRLPKHLISELKYAYSSKELI